MKHFPKFAAVLALGALLGAPALAADPGSPPVAGRSTSVPLSPDAPSSYTVQRGDTLWGIASKFLSQPWYWPEIWYLNPEIKNPHWIYPGDLIRLVYDAEGKPHLTVERGNSVKLSPQMRASALGEAIPAIPFEIVAAFMSKPSVISAEENKTLPYIVALGGSHIVAGISDTAYVRDLSAAHPGERFNLVHVGEPLKDPESHKTLGFQGVYAGMARLERVAPNGGKGKNDLAKIVITESARETLPGDKLVRDRLEVPLDFVPHAPSRPVQGRIMSVIDGVSVIGQYHVVVINRGRNAGLEPGHVLAIWEAGVDVKDRGRGGLEHENEFTAPFAPTVTTPGEHAGTFMVFKAYADLSYGLVMNAENEMHVGDIVKNP